ncbi:dihydropyrimidinase [Achromobacter sp. GG226]|uniref:dihydropyrimidinase n=1 Tax=Verticiella alkaliphila TaxID=2779529 RepID=UPI001C0B3041|nr:dihydropyrimidinase [Verticiella sp. GG226]MBU4609582.1 dihydropyrimidinase [Verticiella sp. GG226]
MRYDLTIRNGRVTTSTTTVQTDIGIIDGKIAAIGPDLAPGVQDIDASGRWVMPGGIDSHVHIEQASSTGVMCADDFYSGSVSAAFGGTTTVIPFAAQHRGHRVPDVIADYSRRAREKAVVDYGFHLILSEVTPEMLAQDLPRAIADGITSFKVYMTYDALKIEDYHLLEVMEAAGREGAMLMIHAENHDVIRWVARRLLDKGLTAPKFHGVAHDPLAETEASARAISLSRLLDVPVLLVHISGPEAIHLIRGAQRLGSKVHAESCPQYLFLTAEDMDRDGLDGAMFCCSPPARDADAQEAVWQGFLDGTLQLYSSDHAPFRFDTSGKLPKGDATTFKEMANGVPGLELRLPLLFSEGVLTGRITPEQFVQLTATNHARMYGLEHCKGDIAVGLDADIVLWDPSVKRTIRWDDLHDNVGYTPYEGREITGWPETVLSRGRVVVDRGELLAERGQGQYVARRCPTPILDGAMRPNPSAASRWLDLRGKAWKSYGEPCQ